MGRLAVILGSSATGPGGAEVTAAAESHAVVLQRHRGTDGAYVLPHRIDHAANLRSLAGSGCDRVLAIASVGSLDRELGVGSFVCPHDFIALQSSVTTFEGPRGHMTVGFDPQWRGQVLSAWAGSGAGALRDGGVYWQTNGPRFETPAEIRLLAAHADLVGMTLASECTVAAELGLPYAAVCVVDNLANGIAAVPLSPAELDRDRERNASRLRDDLAAALRELVE
ncbi:MAG TPA: MTAP family purine nucleoside phosphorylase [Solirubrobacterales bacterium]|nr:MTAP family purine nucleoside phosphorylase [Solirubrobacterales bacterium]